VEFVKGSLEMTRKAPYALNLKPRVVTYQVAFDAAPLEKADYMEWNNLFTLFLELEKNPDSKETANRIAALSGKFQFGKSLQLRAFGQGSRKSLWSFNPKAAAAEQLLASGDVLKYTFAELPKNAGVPFVAVTTTIASEAFATVPAQRKDFKELLATTDFWPVADPELQDLAKRITENCRTDEEKVVAILKWLIPGTHLKFGGPVTGSRYGVKAVLKQGFGHCWDFSDCFVTLSRAAGVPARQVSGWLYGQCGHIWAEVLIDGKNWQQVDPTAGMSCTTDYIPFMTSETGEGSLVYLSMPKIKIVDPTVKGKGIP
jgi:hypothetical protein